MILSVHVCAIMTFSMKTLQGGCWGAMGRAGLNLRDFSFERSKKSSYCLRKKQKTKKKTNKK